MRTSTTHPLEIAEIVAGSGMGKVGLTFCPGKKQSNAATGSWDRDLELDLAVIERWGAAAVVTLIEDHELESLGVAGLGAAVTERHMVWYHLPIRDVGTPAESFEAAWQAAGAQLRAIIQDGFNVVVHCKGGLGRAGMVAARLLVELGWTADTAVAAVRESRPGAIETSAQLGHVMGLGSMPDPFSCGLDAEDRALGAMLGLAVGDALGTTLEFKARDSWTRITEMTGNGPFNLKPGQWTDDTAMALALLDSLTHDPRLDPTDLMQRFVLWHEYGEYSCTGTCFDIGMTVRAALERFKANRDPFAGSTDPNSAGNGSLMRLAPVAIRHWNNHDLLFGTAVQQSRTTHGATQAIEACSAFAYLLADAIAGAPRESVLRPHAGDYEPAIARIMAGSWRGRPRENIRSSGYVAHSLEAALWCVGRTGTFRDAVILAVNLGGDADTTGAITGQLAGALYGASGIPQHWIDQLAWGDEITRRARELFEAGLEK